MAQRMTKRYAVVMPTTPGARPSVVADELSLRKARRVARDASRDRPDLRYCDVRIERDGVLVEYAGPAR